MTGQDLNVAATRIGTHALGPGRRSVVWVQGCPFHCAGCLAPEWIPNRPARRVDPAELAGELLADPGVTGLTLSGGEPMAQAAGLAALVRAARARRDLSVICFTGYRLERLRARPPSAGVTELVGLLDVLIDGQYVARLDDGKGLRGSGNQRVHHLTPRLAGCGYDFTGRPRTAEITVDGPTALLVGVPPPGLLAAFNSAVEKARSRLSLPGTPEATPPAPPATPHPTDDTPQRPRRPRAGTEDNRPADNRPGEDD
ncbi:4Fe-4S single cluster domain-containing protein [Streptomyces sp. NPDC056835]|uniref:4Fe-4S single cluster domain-containing protein n=1 Tax=Streptomyces sp. NPDC056835 TaxID=3345956 RepID=UPI003681D54E